MTPSKLEVNAAIRKFLLTEPKNWSEALRTIVEFGHALPDQGSFFLNYRKTVVQKIGSADDYRLVPIPERSRDVRFGVREEHVGNYEIWKQGEGALNIRIPAVSHSDEIKPARTYLIYYEPDNLTVSEVSLISYKNQFSCFGCSIQKVIALIVFGEGVGEERRIGRRVVLGCNR